ncbi:MAG: sigma-70 family RNA polymerase sigma factor [Hyphomicrobiales bacterium]|nr:sigma-70 family RNA polymerase sigma factor [Hyphomicrobiales bacterium]
MSRNDAAAVLEPLIPALRRYARALVGDADAADDLVQDCLERALSRWWLRRAGDDPKPWLFTILRNLHIDRIRQTRRRGVAVEIDETNEPATTAEQDHGLGVRDALAALDLLPEEQKASILLVGVEDLSYEEAARVLDVPVGTLMSRLSRGRQRLRALIDGGRAPMLRRVK